MIQIQKQNSLGNSISFSKLVIRHRKFLAYSVGTAMLLATLISLLMPNRYEAKLTILPVQKASTGLGSMLAGGGLLSQLSGLSDLSGLPGTVDNLTIILKSYALSQAVIEKLHLQGELHPFRWNKQTVDWRAWTKPVPMDKLVKEFQGKILRVSNPRKGPISVNVEMRDPQLAALAANEMVTGLQSFINNNVLTMGKKHRIFVENQLAQNKIDLTHAEESLKNFEESHKIFSIESQTKLSLQMYWALKSKFIENSVSLSNMEKTFGPESPPSKKLILENQALQEQINELEKKDLQGQGRKSDAFGSLDRVPSFKLQYLRLKRDAMILEKIFELLKEQYEIARAEELKDEISFQVVDKAHPPQIKSSPKRSLIVLFATLLSFMAALGFAFVRENWSSRFEAGREA